MAATRERLEAVIRAQLTRFGGEITSTATCTEAANRATAVILREVDEYTMAEVGLLTPAERRAVLREATS